MPSLRSSPPRRTRFTTVAPFSLAIALALLAALAPPASAGDPALAAAAEAATAALEESSFVAKVDIGNMGKFYVQPDGQPVSARQQDEGGYGKNTIWAPGGSVLVRAGEVGQAIFVATKYPGRRTKENEFWVFLNKKRRVNAAGVAVVFDRPVTPADITPEKIARAIASVATVSGYEPGAAVAAAFDQALESAPAPASSAAAPAGPTPLLVAVRAWTEPGRVARGGEVRLLLEYELAAASGEQPATERLSLLGGDRPLPGYPLEATLGRRAGIHRTSYAQKIPAGAAPGTYTLRAEVCVAGDCIVRNFAFVVD